MVTVIDDPERVHLEHYDIIEKMVKPIYHFGSMLGQDSLFCSIFKYAEDPNNRGEYEGSISIAENNHDVTINADPELFMGIAEEIEKLGYAVTIVY